MPGNTVNASQTVWRNGPLSVSIGLLYGLVMTFLNVCFSILMYMQLENYSRWAGLGVVLAILVTLGGYVWSGIVRFITRRVLFDAAGVTFRESRRAKNPQFVKWEEIAKVRQSESGTFYIHGHDKVITCFDRYYFFEAERLGREIAMRAGKPFTKKL